MRIALLFVALALSGCLDDGEPASTSPAPGAFVSEPFDFHVGLQDDMTFSPIPWMGTVPLGWSYAEWLQGTEAPLWSDVLFEDDVVLSHVNVTLTYRPDAALISTMIRPQFTMWFGAGDSIIEHGFQPGPEVWTGDETVTFPVDSMPLGGLVVEAGTPVTLRVATYYPDLGPLETANLVLDTSSMHLVGRTVDLAHASTPETTVGSVELQGGRCVADLNQLDTAMGSGSFEVPADAVRVEVTLERLDGTGGPDLDFFIQDANGTTVAYAAGPSSPESLLLREPNLALAVPGTWTWHAYNCQPQVAQVQVTADVASPATVASADTVSP